MRVRTSIFLLLLLAVTAFVAGLFEVRRTEEHKFASIAAARERVWRSALADFVERQRGQLRTMVLQHSSVENSVEPGESTLAVLLSNDQAVAKRVWDEKMWLTLRSFGANAVWVYRADGTLFYALANTEYSALGALPEAIGSIPNLFTRETPPHFHFSLPGAASEGQGLRVVEVQGLPIRSVNDVAGTAPPQGYFLAGRIWGGEMLGELPLLSGDDVPAVVPPESDVTVIGGPSTMRFVQDLRDARGGNIARLVVTNKSGALAKIEERGDWIFRLVLAGIMALFVILFLLLDAAIVRPLLRVIGALHSEDLTQLASLRKQKAEFGELARLIQTFFDQQLVLTREMLERIGTEKALRESEEMLRHSQKMEAVGRLAGGVAHDFNNLLTAIIGYADLLRQRFANDPAVCQPAELIHQAGDQAAGLTRQLLAFSRKQLLQPKVIDLNAIIANLHRLLQRIIGEHIVICTSPDATQACVRADPGQIEQVIVNLGVNARDAMPRGGRLTIRTLNLAIDSTEKAGDLVPGDYVAIEVTDTGEGMDAETRSRIFEPFFTTKGPGKGTGLGLATVYGIVRQSHGSIVVESERGVGSTFRILLPRVDGPVEVVEVAPVSAPRSTRAETILVVEDEEIVRELVSEILRGNGYRVLVTDRGTEAVRLVREENGRIDLLISDVVMPEMNGAEVARGVRELAPRAGVLFVSGYSEHDMADQGLEVLVFQVLQKPFTPASLTHKVREVLDACAAAEELKA